MKNLELAKYWYYRLKKQVDANNLNETIRNKISLLEAYLIKYNYIELNDELPQKDYLILLLHAAKHYGKDYQLYIPDIKTDLFKYLWDTRPDGLRYDEYLIQNKSETDNLEVISNALKRLHPYSETTRYEQIITPFTEEDDNNGQIYVENGQKYKIIFKKREYLVPIILIPTENILADSYITFSKYPDSIEIIELKKLFKKIELSEKEVSQIIQDILIDQQISIKSLDDDELRKRIEELSCKPKIIEDLNSKITRSVIDINLTITCPYDNLPIQSEDKPCTKESKDTRDGMYNEGNDILKEHNYESEASKENISITNNKHTRMNKTDTKKLLSRLTNSDYNPASNEIAWMKEQTFKTYRYQWPKFKEMKENFISIFNELKTNGSIPLTEFYNLLNSPSDHFRKTLLNSFLHEINRNSKSDLYPLAQGMKAIVRPKRLPDQTKMVSHIWLIEKK